MGKIIGICGFIGSGKGSVGDILVNRYDYQKISFADKLKDVVATMFSWPRDLIEGDTNESRAWRDIPDPYWSEVFEKDFTPRLAMQLVGTECMRNYLHSDIWVLMVKQHIQNNPDVNWVVPDVRFFNERNMLRDLGGEIWQIRRGSNPEWITDAISDNRYDTTFMADKGVHESEYRWIDYDSEFDVIIENDGTKMDLFQAVENKVSNRR